MAVSWGPSSKKVFPDSSEVLPWEVDVKAEKAAATKLAAEKKRDDEYNGRRQLHMKEFKTNSSIFGPIAAVILISIIVITIVAYERFMPPIMKYHMNIKGNAEYNREIRFFKGSVSVDVTLTNPNLVAVKVLKTIRAKAYFWPIEGLVVYCKTMLPN